MRGGLRIILCVSQRVALPFFFLEENIISLIKKKRLRIYQLLTTHPFCTYKMILEKVWIISMYSTKFSGETNSYQQHQIYPLLPVVQHPLDNILKLWVVHCIAVFQKNLRGFFFISATIPITPVIIHVTGFSLNTIYFMGYNHPTTPLSQQFCKCFFNIPDPFRIT